MIKIRDSVTKNIFDSNEIVLNFIKSQPKGKQEVLRTEYLHGNGFSAWEEKFIKKYGIKSPDGNDISDVKYNLK